MKAAKFFYSLGFPWIILFLIYYNVNKKNANTLFVIINDNFIKFLSRFDEKLIENTHFNSLTPTDNADECEIYLKSLEWALENRKTIKNIAIAGPHGSGKSSIIQTFIKQF